MIALQLIFTILAAVSCIPFAVIAIVFGAKSIKAFVAAKKNADKTPIATLILGIAAAVNGACGACFGGLGILMLILQSVLHV